MYPSWGFLPFDPTDSHDTYFSRLSKLFLRPAEKGPRILHFSCPY